MHCRLPGRLIVFCLFFTHITVHATGVLRNGLNARSNSLAGSDVVFADDPLSALNNNPAAMTQLPNNELQLDLAIGILDAEFENSLPDSDDADSTPGLVPGGAYVHQVSAGLSWGVSFSPVAAVEADWKFTDPPGFLGTYGEQTHKSSFINLRSSLGLAYKFNPRWSVGASIGLIYNRNRLEAPYIFQSHPILAAAGANVLVNLDADGLGVNGVVSTLYQPNDKITLSLSYTTPSWFEADGTLRGFANGFGNFRYNAEVETELPQIISAGMQWQASEPLTLGLQFDWINWSNAFEDLPIHLTNGTNAALNGFLGSTRIDDTTPLDWDDQYVIHLAGEYEYSDKLTLRAGYSYANNPVPDATLTPTTAAITEHSLGVGFGYRLDKYQLDVGYQWQLPNGENVGTSKLRAGEYSNSNVDVSIHLFSIGITVADPF